MCAEMKEAGMDKLLDAAFQCKYIQQALTFFCQPAYEAICANDSVTVKIAGEFKEGHMPHSSFYTGMNIV